MAWLVVRVFAFLCIIQSIATETLHQHQFLKHLNFHRCLHRQDPVRWQPKLVTSALQRAVSCQMEVDYRLGELVNHEPRSSHVIATSVINWYNNKELSSTTANTNNTSTPFIQVMSATDIGCATAKCNGETHVVCHTELPQTLPTVSTKPLREEGECTLKKKRNLAHKDSKLNQLTNALTEEDEHLKVTATTTHDDAAATTQEGPDGWQFVCKNCKWGGSCPTPSNAGIPLGPDLDLYGCTLACDESVDCMAVEWSTDSCILYNNVEGGSKDCLLRDAAKATTLSVNNMQSAEIWKRVQKVANQQLQDPLCEDFTGFDFTAGSGTAQSLGYGVIEGVCVQIVGRTAPNGLTLLPSFEECEKRCESAATNKVKRQHRNDFEKKIKLLEQPKWDALGAAPDADDSIEDPCDSDPCSINAQCGTSLSGSLICECLNGFLGNPFAKDDSGCRPKDDIVALFQSVSTSCATGNLRNSLRSQLSTELSIAATNIVVNGLCASNKWTYTVTITGFNTVTAPPVRSALGGAALLLRLRQLGITPKPVECGHGKFFNTDSGQCLDCEAGSARQEGYDLVSCQDCGEAGTDGKTGQRFCGGKADGVLILTIVHTGDCGTVANQANLLASVAAFFGIVATDDASIEDQLEINIDYSQCIPASKSKVISKARTLAGNTPGTIKIAYLSATRLAELQEALNNPNSPLRQNLRGLDFELSFVQTGLSLCVEHSNQDQSKRDNTGFYNYDLVGATSRTKKIQSKGYGNFLTDAGVVSCGEIRGRVVIPRATLFTTAAQCRSVCGVEQTTPVTPDAPSTPDGGDVRCVTYSEKYVEEEMNDFFKPGVGNTRTRTNRGYANYMVGTALRKCAALNIRRVPPGISLFQTEGDCKAVCFGDVPPPPTPGGSSCVMYDFDSDRNLGTGFFLFDKVTRPEGTRKIASFVPPIYGNFINNGNENLCQEFRGRSIPPDATYWPNPTECLRECDDSGNTPSPVGDERCATFQEFQIPTVRNRTPTQVGIGTYVSSRTGDTLVCAPVWGSSTVASVPIFGNNQVDLCLDTCGISRIGRCNPITRQTIEELFEPKQLTRGGNQNHPNTLFLAGYAVQFNTQGNSECAPVKARFVPSMYNLFSTPEECRDSCGFPISTLAAPLPDDADDAGTTSEKLHVQSIAEESGIHIQLRTTKGIQSLALSHNGNEVADSHPNIHLATDKPNQLVLTVSNDKQNPTGAGVLVSFVNNNRRQTQMPRVVHSIDWSCMYTSDEAEVPKTAEEALRKRLESAATPHDRTWLPAVAKGTNQVPVRHPADQPNSKMPSTAQWIWFDSKFMTCILNLDEMMSQPQPPRKCIGDAIPDENTAVHTYQTPTTHDECHNLCSNHKTCTNWVVDDLKRTCTLHNVPTGSPSDCQY